MGPSIEAVMRGRYWMSSVLRIGALLMVLWGALGFLSNALEFLPSLAQGGNAVQVAWMMLPLRWVLVAAAVMWFERWMVSWIFPLPRGGCPQCGYPVGGREVCPECGLHLQVADAGGRERAVRRPEEVASGAPPGYPR